MIANFVWNGKKNTHLNMNYYLKLKKKEDWEPQMKKKYYYATQILTIMKWMRPEPKENVINIEK